MSLENLKNDILRFSEEREWGKFHSPKNLAMAVAAEAGELLEVFMWLTEDESRTLTDKQRTAVKDEIGDVLICLLNLAARLGVDPVVAGSEKMEKNRLKYPVEKSRGTAKKYDET